MIQRMLEIWSLVPLPFLNPAWTSGSSRFMNSWRLAWRILSITLLECEMSASFPGSSDGKASAYNAGDLGSIPGSGRSPGEGNGNPLQYSCLENSMDQGAWWATVNGVAKSWIRLSGFTLSILWHCLSLGLEWKLIFSSPMATAEFSTFAGILSAALWQVFYYYTFLKVQKLHAAISFLKTRICIFHLSVK